MKKWDWEHAEILCNPLSKDKEGFIEDLGCYIEAKKPITLKMVERNGMMFGFSKEEALKIYREWQKEKSIESRF